MMTILLYLIVMALVGAMIFLAASAVFGRSEELPPLPPGTTATVLPAEDVTGADVDALRFQQVLRGYKASEVDWACIASGWKSILCVHNWAVTSGLRSW